MIRSVPLLVLVSLALVAGACGSGDVQGDAAPRPATPVPTLGGVGDLPASASGSVPMAPAPVVRERLPVGTDATTAALIGERAAGNRVLMLGDSILASTSSRYGNQMCDALVPLGWRVDVEAEPSRFVEFGNKVLDKLLVTDAAPADDWNAAVVFLGSNYRGDPAAYETELREILDRLSPRPILLLTVTVYRPEWAEVNEVVNRLGAEYDNVTVLDWKALSDYRGVLSSDRLHPTDAGRQVLAEAVAGALGPVPGGEGECLKSAFRDDSAVRGKPDNVLGKPSTGSSGSAGSGRAPTTTTTVKPATVPTTTVRGAGPTTTVPAAGVTTTMAPSGGGNTPTTSATPVTTVPVAPTTVATPVTLASSVPTTTAAP